jgi:hypothetical protein
MVEAAKASQLDFNPQDSLFSAYPINSENMPSARKTFLEKLERDNKKQLDSIGQDFLEKVSKIDKPEDYLNKLITDIDLSNLYKIRGMSNVTQQAKYCAVMLECNPEHCVNGQSQDQN